MTFSSRPACLIASFGIFLNVFLTVLRIPGIVSWVLIKLYRYIMTFPSWWFGSCMRSAINSRNHGPIFGRWTACSWLGIRQRASRGIFHWRLKCQGHEWSLQACKYHTGRFAYGFSSIRIVSIGLPQMARLPCINCLPLLCEEQVFLFCDE
jgi:hypothetical protein